MKGFIRNLLWRKGSLMRYYTRVLRHKVAGYLKACLTACLISNEDQCPPSLQGRESLCRHISSHAIDDQVNSSILREVCDAVPYRLL